MREQTISMQEFYRGIDMDDRNASLLPSFDEIERLHATPRCTKYVLESSRVVYLEYQQPDLVLRLLGFTHETQRRILAEEVVPEIKGGVGDTLAVTEESLRRGFFTHVPCKAEHGESVLVISLRL